MMKYPKQEDLNNGNCKKRSIEIHYPDFYKYIIENYNCETWNENLYWFYKGLKEHPVCPVCGKPTRFINIKEGYRVYCSKKCSNSDLSKKELTKQTCMTKYGGVAPACSKEVRNKMEKANLERFGVVNAMQNKEISNRSQQTREELYGGCGNASKKSQKRYKETLLKKYGVDNPMKSEDIQESFKNSLFEKYGVYYTPQIPGITEKISRTKRLNHTFGTSQIENLFEHYLKDNNIEYEYQYKCDRYPFNCDFYIKEYDLFIEIQANWCHGFCAFDKNNEYCVEKLNIWKSKKTKFYENAIETWTIRDVKKRNIAKENNLNYLEIFSNNIDEVIHEYAKAINKFRLGGK